MTRRQVLALAHDPDSGSGLVGRRFEKRGFEVVEHVVCDDVYEPGIANPFPDHTDFEVIVPMGSVWSVYDTETIGAWIGDELELLRSAHESGTPVLGICFGGQALAAALGGLVEPSPTTEIGWYEIFGESNPISPGPWMEWHHDRFEPPPGAEVLAVTDVSPQLYRIDHSVGTQFHPEVDAAHVDAWLHYAPDEYLASHGLDRQNIRADVARHEGANRVQCAGLVDWFIDNVAGLG